MIQPTSLVARALDGAPLALDHFPAAGGTSAPNVPILLVHGYAQNRWTFHHPTRSLAEHLAGRGHDTFVAELRGHGRSRALGAPLPQGVRDYLDLDLPGLLGELRSRTGAARGLLLGHSLGGLLCLLLAGSRPEEVAGVCA
ncbi:MAG: alpha/beta fold hydrolase, partial [Deltaproteobacteria bacterium]|nr:alpha/beta fold hydrolase [Deltaproteobacteria bacterium]